MSIGIDKTLTVIIKIHCISTLGEGNQFYGIYYQTFGSF